MGNAMEQPVAHGEVTSVLEKLGALNLMKKLLINNGYLVSENNWPRTNLEEIWRVTCLYEVTECNHFCMPSDWDAEKVAEVASVIESATRLLSSVRSLAPLQGLKYTEGLCKRRSTVECSSRLVGVHINSSSYEVHLGSKVLQVLKNHHVELKQQHVALSQIMRSTEKCSVCTATERQLDEIRNTKEHLQMELDKTSREKECIQSENIRTSSKLQDLQASSDSMKEEIAKHVHEIEQLKMRLAESSLEKAHLQAANTHLAHQIHDVIKEQEELKEELKKNRQLECKLAILTDRCERLDTETVRLRGEKDDLISKLVANKEDSKHPYVSPRVQCADSASRDPEGSVLSDGPGSWIEVASQGVGSDNSSLVSVGTSEGHCFMSASLFKTATCEETRFVYACELVNGSEVLAADGITPLKVVGAPKSHTTNRLVELRAGNSVLTVTRDHRIPMLDHIHSARREAKAVELRPGNLVFVEEIPVPLSSVRECFSECEEVVQITFSPDLPVGVITEPAAIASHGSKKKQVRRGGMRKRGDRAPHEVVQSLPNGSAKSD